MNSRTLLTKGAVGLALLGATLVCGCNKASSVPQPVVEKSQAPLPTVRKLPENEIRECVHGAFITLAPSSTFRTSGDLRPFWTVSGAIHNECDFDLKSVTIRVIAYRKGNSDDTLDTADLTVDDVPFHSVKAYRREIQLMNNRTQKFGFTYEFTAATGEFEP